MKSLHILTKTPIDTNTIKAEIKELYKTKKLYSETEVYLYIGVAPNSFIIDFNNEGYFSGPDCFFSEKTINLVPIKNPVFAILSYHKPSIARKIVSVILKHYKEVWVYDDEYLWIGPAQEYINSNHQTDVNYIGYNHESLLYDNEGKPIPFKNDRK